MPTIVRDVQITSAYLSTRYDYPEEGSSGCGDRIERPVLQVTVGPSDDQDDDDHTVHFDRPREEVEVWPLCKPLTVIITDDLQIIDMATAAASYPIT
jgi:hypothetical protein